LNDCATLDAAGAANVIFTIGYGVKINTIIDVGLALPRRHRAIKRAGWRCDRDQFLLMSKGQNLVSKRDA
jgi:hypothetical protein